MLTEAEVQGDLHEGDTAVVYVGAEGKAWARERRQTLGRGLRLCVNQKGERIHDEDVNVLTVVANESYREFAEKLQQEYVATGDAPPPLPYTPAFR